MKRLYIFDFDGTLLFSMVDSITSFNKALEKYDIEPYPMDNIEHFNYNDFGSYIYNTLKNHDLKDAEKEVPKLYQKIYFENKKENSYIYPGIKEMLKELDSNGIKMAICSNRSQDILYSECDQFLEGFDFVDVTGYIKGEPPKQDPFKINRTIKNVGVSKEETVYIGDRADDIVAAKNAGIDCVLVNWGQGDKADYKDPYLMKVVSEPKDLVGL